jgi:hypothetical protein
MASQQEHIDLIRAVGDVSCGPEQASEQSATVLLKSLKTAVQIATGEQEPKLQQFKRYFRELFDHVCTIKDLFLSGSINHASAVADLRDKIREAPAGSPERARLKSTLQHMKSEWWGQLIVALYHNNKPQVQTPRSAPGSIHKQNPQTKINEDEGIPANLLIGMVGVAGFEPTTPSPPD